MNLKNIDIYNNPNLNMENIGLYIIKGINVLLCKNSCHRDATKMYSETYDEYVSKLMKYFLNRFYNPESRYTILLTMSKMKEVDDSLLKMVGINSLKPLSNMFNKFTGEF